MFLSSPVFCPLYMTKCFFNKQFSSKNEKYLMKIYTVNIKSKTFILIHYFKMNKIGQFLGLNVSEKKQLGLSLNLVMSSIHKMVKHTHKKLRHELN